MYLQKKNMSQAKQFLCDHPLKSRNIKENSYINGIITRIFADKTSNCIVCFIRYKMGYHQRQDY